ncbi:MAG: c-type cytochrome [Betaproteobacteria bacterium]
MRARLKRQVAVMLVCGAPLLVTGQAPPPAAPPIALAPTPSTIVDATAAQAAAEKYYCSGCHQMDAKVVGPGWKEVAAKYRADKDAPARLADKVKKGSVNTWGAIPMPPNEAVPDADIKLIVAWVLSL